MTDINQ